MIDAWVLEQLGVEKSLRVDIIARKLSSNGHVTRHHYHSGFGGREAEKRKTCSKLA